MALFLADDEARALRLIIHRNLSPELYEAVRVLPYDADRPTVRRIT